VRRIAQELDLAPLLATILAQRGMHDGESAKAFLEPSVDELLDPSGLADLDKAAERVARALIDGETILIYGDADADGLSATGLLCQFLSSVGAQPKVHVPNRAFESYSFNEGGLAAIEKAGATLVISVDNGTSSIDPVAELQARGVDVIITDHHLPGDELPPAYAVINPCRNDCSYGFDKLAGVGVAFKLACGVAAQLRERGRNGERMASVLGEVMAWVAMGTVSDVMPLRGENRVLVSRGLRAMPRSTSPALRALCAVAGIGSAADCRTEDIAFRLAPRLNAASRLARSDLSVALVTATDDDTCRRLARELDDLNKQRQIVERELLFEVTGQLGEWDGDGLIMLSSDSWNTGLLGLVAGRLSRQHGVPAVLASWSNGNPGKGSCRSVAGFDVHAALDSAHEHLVQHGGHAMAAGFSIEREAYPEFAASMQRSWAEHLAIGTPLQPLEYDGELPLAALTLGLLRQLEQLEPFGEGNQRPILVTPGVDVGDVRRMGGDGTHLALRVSQGPTSMRVVAFNRGDLVDQLSPGQHIDLLHRPKINRFRGVERVELELVDMRNA
jgi:single-stranded-DNA-specific exonuclease